MNMWSKSCIVSTGRSYTRDGSECTAKRLKVRTGRGLSQNPTPNTPAMNSAPKYRTGGVCFPGGGLHPCTHRSPPCSQGSAQGPLLSGHSRCRIRPQEGCPSSALRLQMPLHSPHISTPRRHPRASHCQGTAEGLAHGRLPRTPTGPATPASPFVGPVTPCISVPKLLHY